MKRYSITFNQNFYETRVIEANDEEEAKSKLIDEWSIGGAEVIIHSTEEESESE